MQFITVSRKLGANGTRIAKLVAEKLSFPLYDTETINNLARRMGLFGDIAEMDATITSVFHRIVSHQPKVAINRMTSVIYELAKNGNAVFLGRGSQILLGSYRCSLNIMITASLEKRIQNLVERGLNKKTALDVISKSDHERASFIKYAFNADWGSAELYDLVLNMDKLTMEVAADTIVNTARSDAIQACYLDSMMSIGMLALSRRVEAALEESLPADESPLAVTYGISITVKVDKPGKVTLTGFVHDEAHKIKAEEIVKGAEGVGEIDNRIQVISVVAG